MFSLAAIRGLICRFILTVVIVVESGSTKHRNSVTTPWRSVLSAMRKTCTRFSNRWGLFSKGPGSMSQTTGHLLTAHRDHLRPPSPTTAIKTAAKNLPNPARKKAAATHHPQVILHLQLHPHRRTKLNLQKINLRRCCSLSSQNQPSSGWFFYCRVFKHSEKHGD